MTIRDLLSSFDKNAAVRLHIFDSEWSVKELKICFNPGAGLEWIYEDDMEELDNIADYKINRWHVLHERIRIQIDGTFREE